MGRRSSNKPTGPDMSKFPDINPAAPLWKMFIPYLQEYMKTNGMGMPKYPGQKRAGTSPMQKMGREYAMKRAQSGGPASWDKASSAMDRMGSGNRMGGIEDLLKKMGGAEPEDWQQTAAFDKMYATGTPPQFNPFESQPEAQDPRVAMMMAQMQARGR